MKDYDKILEIILNHIILCLYSLWAINFSKLIKTLHKEFYDIMLKHLSNNPLLSEHQSWK